MTALIKERNTPERGQLTIGHPVEATTILFAGSIGVLNASGNAISAATATGLKAPGRVEQTVDNSSGAAGDEIVTFKKGTFCYNNDGSINRTHIDGFAYIVDDQTVAATDGGGTRSEAGKIEDVDATGVWVTFD
ncbi:hypothetical protein [Methylophaga nitratireducenticrescens]|uniref:hypothetical protein n=1 Tax=Methylophaga nitratireducenticrescens TaxID=754476 RepID=UPI000CDC2106|nr:hypothetical protein [Methylophaga nitratireducenticrescens]AUZ85855.1 hypothetical protein CDW43_15340 [Methylophaga nitratireducenticrescens]